MGYARYVNKNRIIVDMRGDNQGAIVLAKNPQLTERSKHIDVSYYFICDLNERQRVSIKFAPTNVIAADGLTKPLSRPGFEKFRKQVGMVLPANSKADA